MKRVNKIFLLIAVLTVFGSAMTAFAEAKPGNGKDDAFFYYTIQKGDTLWDLSWKFYNSSWAWPGLWSINDRLSNPHWLYPGNQIKIRPKETADKRETSAMHGDGPIIVKPDILPSFYYSGMDRLSFIKSDPVPPMGKILKGKNNQILMTENEIVYIAPTADHRLVPDQLYMIYRTEPVVYPDNGDGKREVTGIKHQIKGMVRVLENHGEYVTAKITSSFRPAGAGNMIMACRKRDRQIKVRDNMEPIQGRLIGSDDNNELLSTGSIAFLNMGTDDGIQKGQMYTVFEENQPAEAFRNIELLPLETGTIIVLGTEKRTSTVMVVSVKKEVSPGALVGLDHNLDS
ncbi:MAG: LysM domain-containing protein [Desulfobacteraceae bacterium]